MRKIVVTGSDEVSRAFSKSLSSLLGAELCEPTYKTFPDGEKYLRLDCNISGAEVIYVKTMIPAQDSSIVEAVLAADAIKASGAERLVMIAPYMAYARQDRQFLAGEPVSIRAVLKALWTSGFSALATVEVHKAESLRHFPGPSLNVRPYSFMADQIGLKGSDIVVISPDLGALERAKTLAEHLGVSYDYLEKSRDRLTGNITIKPKEVSVEGKHVVIVDDIISTGSTIASAVAMLSSQGARGFTILVAHAILAPGAEERLRSVGITKIYAANTTPSTSNIVTNIDVAPLVASELRSSGIISQP